MAPPAAPHPPASASDTPDSPAAAPPAGAYPAPTAPDAGLRPRGTTRTAPAARTRTENGGTTR
jgi:hypothetical protein